MNVFKGIQAFAILKFIIALCKKIFFIIKFFKKSYTDKKT